MQRRACHRLLANLLLIRRVSTWTTSSISISTTITTPALSKQGRISKNYCIGTAKGKQRTLSPFSRDRIHCCRTSRTCSSVVSAAFYPSDEGEAGHSEIMITTTYNMRRQDQLASVLERLSFSPQQSNDISSCFQSFVSSDFSTNQNNSKGTGNATDCTVVILSKNIMETAEQFCQLQASNVKLKGRRALEDASQRLLLASKTTSSYYHPASPILAATLVVIALALEEDPMSRSGHRSIASAIISTVDKQMKGKNHDSEEDRGISPHSILRALFQEATTTRAISQNSLSSFSVDWHIISGLAKALQVTCRDDEVMASAVTSVISEALHLDEMIQKDDNVSVGSEDRRVLKNDAAAALALAAQLEPWQTMESKLLVDISVQHNLWHAAERICSSATSSTCITPKSIEAVEALLEAALQAKHYRQADTFATEFFNVGGQSRFLEARYLHACATIAKVIRKGAIPIVDKQIDRVEKSGELLIDKGKNVDMSISMNPATVGDDIRRFALQQLEESGNVDAAHRLAKVWQMDYMYDEKALIAAEKARRKKYLQWEDVLTSSPPDLISTPNALVAATKQFYENIKGDDTIPTVFGFDVEWNEDDAGADLLQIANRNTVLLIDIPALSRTPEGVTALEQTVGAMFESPSCIMMGFACNQDVSKLRSSPTCYQEEKDDRKKHWFDASQGVSDLQAVVAGRDANLGRLGLSRVCEKYLGKPLDKSEQCSFWNARPLSLRQRTYAALDAWVIVRIYDKIRDFPL